VAAGKIDCWTADILGWFCSPLNCGTLGRHILLLFLEAEPCVWVGGRTSPQKF
jgi:hypothetical protein